jgi:hypothetical protein
MTARTVLAVHKPEGSYRQSFTQSVNIVTIFLVFPGMAISIGNGSKSFLLLSASDSANDSLIKTR